MDYEALFIIGPDEQSSRRMWRHPTRYDDKTSPTSETGKRVLLCRNWIAGYCMRQAVNIELYHLVANRTIPVSEVPEFGFVKPQNTLGRAIHSP
jgi:hypothetical protein